MHEKDGYKMIVQSLMMLMLMMIYDDVDEVWSCCGRTTAVIFQVTEMTKNNCHEMIMTAEIGRRALVG